ncbi:MAG: gephyrin-like molybdotransferase Glp [Anaerolineales bacterium]
MPEFLHLLPPDEARQRLFAHLPPPSLASERLPTLDALGRVLAAPLRAPHALPSFPRASVDGYAVRARDTFGASESLPAYLTLIGEVPMGQTPAFALRPGTCALIHTGGALPEGADAVVMLEHTQSLGDEIEVLRAVAPGENIIQPGEDVQEGEEVILPGHLLRPAEIGGLMALGILDVEVWKRPRLGLISSGDEVVPPQQTPKPGQVRDINTYSLAALILQYGGEPRLYGIVPDQPQALQQAAEQALDECDALIITAGSSASTRDMTAEVIQSLGAPGVLVHGINTRPGKPTILGVCGGKAVIGLPGNPVSALVNGYLFVRPLLDYLLSRPSDRPQTVVRARLSVNLPSQAGREDWWPVRLTRSTADPSLWIADPIFGKSNLIFTLVHADGLLRILPDATGLEAGQEVEVMIV